MINIYLENKILILLLDGVRICLTFVLLLFKRVNVGVDDEDCIGVDTSRTVCGDCTLRFPIVIGLCC
jgi:hypothetical protein